MTANIDLTKLEGLVENLIQKYNTLKDEKVAIEVILSNKEQYINELNEQINSLTNDKSEINNRVSTLIGFIEEWEQLIINENDQPAVEQEYASENDNNEQSG